MPVNSGLPKSKRKKLQNSINAHINNASNPHNTTKTQVGLGNVPNVATNDQTPTYTVASSNSNLTSGEKLTVAMGKIAKAIASLITHLADTVSHITSAERTNWNDANSKKHSHSNKTILDNTTASYTTAEKSKLSGIATGANKTTVDSALSSTSTNPVQNKVLQAELAKKAEIKNNWFNKNTDGTVTINRTSYKLILFELTASCDGIGYSTRAFVPSSIGGTLYYNCGPVVFHIIPTVNGDNAIFTIKAYKGTGTSTEVPVSYNPIGYF